MTIGNRMREIRGKLGMTQAELAEKLDIDEKRLSDYENGNLVPSSVIQDLARITDCSQRLKSWGSQNLMENNIHLDMFRLRTNLRN